MQCDKTDLVYSLRLLRARCDRPRGCRPPEQGDELAPSDHSITSSARRSNEVGMSMPSALAVLRLTIVSNLVARSTGISDGLVPLRILSTNVAARRNWWR